MTVSVGLSPTYPIPEREFAATFTCSTGNFVRIICTDAPDGSKLRQQLDEQDASEIQVSTAKAGQKIDLSFDRPGKYVCKLVETTRNSPALGGYDGDPDGDETETAHGYTSYSFVIGQRLTATIRMGAESGELALWVWDDSVVATTLPQQGEVTPSFTGDSELMKIVSKQASVVSALAAMVGDVDDLSDDPIDVINDIIAKYNVHALDDSLYHPYHGPSPWNFTQTIDASSYLLDSVSGDVSYQQVLYVLTELRQRLYWHITNDYTGGDPAYNNDVSGGPGSRIWHSRISWDTIPVIESASDQLTAGLLTASIWLAYESHRALGVPIHQPNADTTNVLLPVGTLYQFYQAVESALKSITAPDTESEAVSLLVSRDGFTKG